MANEGVAKLNEALKNLTPVDVLCETSCVNGLYAISGEDYMVESFYDGPHVSKYAMMASYSIAEKSNSTLTDSNNSNVTYFNSKGFITDGLLASGYNYDSTDRTFSQFDAYSNTECGPEDYQGYDSVRIKTTDENGDESFVYMTYGQYVNSKYYKE